MKCGAPSAWLWIPECTTNTGHASRWWISFARHTAMDEPNIQTEVDRYIAWPAQALSYQLGKMKILELRERARHELGSNFDIRSFHDAVLDEGALPLDLLETKIDLWIKSQATAGKK